MTPEALRARREQLVAEQQRLKMQHDRLIANLNAYDGAIQEVDHWIARLEGENDEAGDSQSDG
jgi:hypothetical protein